MNPSNKKVIIVGPAHPYRGGQALVEAYMHNALSTAGFDTSTVSYTLLYPSIFFPGTTQFDSSSLVPFEHASKIKRLLNSINPLTWIKTARYINKQKPDAVLFVWWMPFFGPALSTVASLLNKQIKVLFLVENYISHENRWFDTFFTKITLKYADAFICQSAYINQQISNDFMDKPVFQTTLSIYDCYNLNTFSKDSARQKLGITTSNVVLFFGLIRPYKGLDKLLIAFADYLKKHGDCTLLVVGECYENIDKYTNLINKLELSKNVQMHNYFVPNEEIEPFFKAADLSCLPYNSGTQSGILMMAYGFKIPVVTTRVGGIAELVKQGETGVVIENNESSNLVNGMHQLLSTKMQVDYSQNIEKFTEELGYKGLSNFIESVLK